MTWKWKYFRYRRTNVNIIERKSTIKSQISEKMEKKEIISVMDIYLPNI